MQDVDDYRIWLGGKKPEKLIDCAKEAGFTEQQADFLERMCILMSGGQWKERPK